MGRLSVNKNVPASNMHGQGGIGEQPLSFAAAADFAQQATVFALGEKGPNTSKKSSGPFSSAT
jgi:hypothetical protein